MQITQTVLWESWKFTFDDMDSKDFQQIFKGLVRPHVEYASSVRSPHLIKQKDAIEAVQRRATKCIAGFYYLTYNEYLCRHKLPTLAYREKHMATWYNYIKSWVPLRALTNHFQNPSYNTLDRAYQEIV